MKIGVLVSKPNREYPLGTVCNDIYSIDTVWHNQLSQLFPGEPFYVFNIYEPDFDMMKKVDLVFCTADCISDKAMGRYIKNIPCKVATHIRGGYEQLSRLSWEDLAREKEILDASDFVISMDYEYLDVLRLYTDTPVFWWPLPYPVEQMLAVLENNDVPEYDIVIPYSPYQSVNTNRNGYIAAMIGNKIIDNVPGYNNMGIFGWTPTKDRQLEQAGGVARSLGCDHFEMLPFTSGIDVIKIIAKAKMVLFLDYTRAAGRWAIETAITKTPLVFSDTIPFARYIYGNIGVQNPFDVEAAISAARKIQDNKWEQSWLDKAYNRATDFSIENSARILKERCNAF